MARVTNLEACFDSVIGELGRRVSGLTHPTHLRIATDIGSIHLSLMDGRLRLAKGAGHPTTVRLSQNHLTQLLMGYLTPTDLFVSGKLKAPRAVHAFLDRLFPLHTAQMWWSDRF